ncbi:seizure 6-like protein isoform X3 [Ornithorhynchus anatinus]|uniref:Seizure 6-like protein n=1 Tax=Ornithorhynchus anatinus TaxID=9258 RepID=A0A6I8PCF9_ORNAN|nr:seizure 6-like protein isoform X3 [Ornithorhynchus anatinus]
MPGFGGPGAPPPHPPAWPPALATLATLATLSALGAGLRPLGLLLLLLGSPGARAGDPTRDGRTPPARSSHPLPEEPSDGKIRPENADPKETTVPNPVLSSVEFKDPAAAGGASPPSHGEALPASTPFPDAEGKLAFPSGDRTPSLKPVSTGRGHPRPKTAPSGSPMGPARSGPGATGPTSSPEKPPWRDDAVGRPADARPGTPRPPFWLGTEEVDGGPTASSSLQISPYTSQPPRPRSPDEPDAAGSPQGEAPGPEGTEPKGAENELALEESQETTTSTIVTTTVTTTERTPASCGVSFVRPEGFIDSADYPPQPRHDFLECTYNVTVYTGYGVELQVKSVNLSEGELLAIRGVDGPRLTLLANQSLLVEGQVIRSPTHTLSVYFRTFQDDGTGAFQLHYQAFMLSCRFPRRPAHGEVTVLDLHAGGLARFHCHLGYQLQGPDTLTCLNASRPHWTSREPICSAPCGGSVVNATMGRVLSPSLPGPANGTRACTWTLAAPEGQKLHLHFERLALAHRDRMVVSSGHGDPSGVLYDSLQTEAVPFEGLLSEGSALRIHFTTDRAGTDAAFNIRFEAFEKGHCYEPYIHNGNFTTSDPTYSVGAVVEFACDPGRSLDQGPPTIECVNVRDPYWNDTEPLCRALCGGELSAVAGVILSPNWPDPYAEGEDCIWRIHVGEDKRIFLDVELLNLSDSDTLTVYDGDETSLRVLGQFAGSGGPQKLYSSTPDLTVRLRSAPARPGPAGPAPAEARGFAVNYVEVSRNDSCPDLPEIQNGWKTTSHAEPGRGAGVTYRCDPGYDVVGSETLTCQWDLSWSGDPPFCEKIMYCTDPGGVEHSSRLVSDPVLPVGATVQYSCDPGFVLEGSSLLTCYSRETGTPIWTSRLPRCVSEETLACDNPGLPDNGYQILYKRLYLPGESLTFMCYEGFELVGQVTIQCILGQPSRWSGPLPVCRVNRDSFEHALEVAEAAAQTSLEGGNMALAIFIPVLVISLLLGGAYIYITRCRYYSNLRLPLMYSHPYSQITVETEFDNPIYETGETREYEVSI